MVVSLCQPVNSDIFWSVSPGVGHASGARQLWWHHRGRRPWDWSCNPPGSRLEYILFQEWVTFASANGFLLHEPSNKCGFWTIPIYKPSEFLNHEISHSWSTVGSIQPFIIMSQWWYSTMSHHRFGFYPGDGSWGNLPVNFGMFCSIMKVQLMASVALWLLSLPGPGPSTAAICHQV